MLRALQAGIDTYVTKPFAPPQLHTKIQTVLAKRSRQKIVDIISNQDVVDCEDEFPIIIFGESHITTEDLSLINNKMILTFLADTTTGVRIVDERHTRLPCRLLANRQFRDGQRAYAHAQRPH